MTDGEKWVGLEAIRDPCFQCRSLYEAEAIIAQLMRFFKLCFVMSIIANWMNSMEIA